ncbi:hypothetical protein [Synechococcus sp. M16CYN]|uniref:hypothetical protein n=1 Tax=Synechococcus sp. M16CYN TaxID=3103139 RepID=UPI003253E113
MLTATVEIDMKRTERRQRLHELLLALIAREEELPLMDEELPALAGGSTPARWLDQNRRTLHRYQALVRTVVTLDALLDAEDTSQNLNPG